MLLELPRARVHIKPQGDLTSLSTQIAAAPGFPSKGSLYGILYDRPLKRSLIGAWGLQMPYLGEGEQGGLQHLEGQGTY